MKKLFIVIVVSLLVLAGCSTTSVDHEVKTSAILEKIENEDSFILYIGSKTCEACKQFAPVYQEVAAEYPEYMYSVEITNAMANDKTDFELLQENVIGVVTQTPSIYVIKDGVVVNKSVGVLKYSQLEQFLTTYDIKK